MKSRCHSRTRFQESSQECSSSCLRWRPSASAILPTACTRSTRRQASCTTSLNIACTSQRERAPGKQLTQCVNSSEWKMEATMPASRNSQQLWKQTRLCLTRWWWCLRQRGLRSGKRVRLTFKIEYMKILSCQFQYSVFHDSLKCADTFTCEAEL